MTQITDAKILILSTNGFEQSELERPLNDLKANGATVHVATPDGNDIKGWDKDDWGNTIAADKALSDVTVDDYDAIVLPGGQINPDLLRANDRREKRRCALRGQRSCCGSGHHHQPLSRGFGSVYRQDRRGSGRR